MSSDTSSLPAWKQALLDRKRHLENGGTSITPSGETTRAGTGSGANTTTDPTPSTGWKQTTLSKRLQQYTASSFFSAPSATVDKETTGNGTDSTSNHTSGVPEIQVGSADDLLVEDRLLPIKQNPILLSDRQKRRQPKTNHSRQEKRSSRKSDPRAPSTKSVGSDEGFPSASDGSVTPDASPVILVEDAGGDEVFEEEVTYGKGFVHKLLKKFITLTGKDEPTSVVAPTKTKGSAGDAPKGSRNSSRVSASEKDLTEKKPSKGTVNSDFESSRRSWEEGAICGTDPVKTAGSEVEVHLRSEVTNDLETNIVATEDLPHNIVSAARGIFELNSNPVKPSRKKYNAPEKPSVDRPTLRRSALEKPTIEVTAPDRSSIELPASNVQTVEQTKPADISPSLRRPATDKPIAEEFKISNSSKSNEDSESVSSAVSAEPAAKPLQSAASYGRFSYPARVGPKGRVRLENETNGDSFQSKPSTDNSNNNDGDQSIVIQKPPQTGSLPLPLVHSDKLETASGNSIEIPKPDMPDTSEEKPISVRAASKLYEAKNEKTQHFRLLDNQVEQKSMKTVTKPSVDSYVNKSTNSVNSSRTYTGMSVTDKEQTTSRKEEIKSSSVPVIEVAETRIRRTDWKKSDDIDTSTLSDSKVTTTMTQDFVSIRTATPSTVHVNVVATDNVQPNQEQQKDVQTRDLTTRVQIGSFASSIEKSPQSSSVVGYTSNSAPSEPSIRKKDQVTVIQIGSAIPPGRLENNTEVKATVGKAGESKENDVKAVYAGRLSDEKTDSSIGKKGTMVQVQDDIETKVESVRDHNGIVVDNKNDIGTRLDTMNDVRNDTRFEARNDIKNDSNRHDTRNDVRNDTHRNYANSQNLSKSEATSHKVDDRGASRPGMLLIRPASNLVASKTKTEYLTMTKYNDIKKGEFAPAKQRPIAVEDFITNGDVVDRGGGGGVVVEGGGVTFGRSMLDKTKHGMKLSINFDDSALCTHEYPSEQSLMAATPAQPGDCDYVDENAPMNVANNNANDDDPVSNDDDPKSSDLWGSNPALTTTGILASYVPRGQMEFEFGMHRSDDVGEVAPPGPDPESKSRSAGADGLSESTEEDTTWSHSASSDLLF